MQVVMDQTSSCSARFTISLTLQDQHREIPGLISDDIFTKHLHIAKVNSDDDIDELCISNANMSVYMASHV